MGYRTFLFFCRRSPYIKQFSEYGDAKVLNARIFLFCRRRAADFCFAPPCGKNQIVPTTHIIEAAYQEGQAKLKGNGKSVPPLAAIKTPLRDGDIGKPDDPAYANAYFIKANSATAPGIVDAVRNPVLTRSEVYSGVYGRASINLYAFNSNGNKGIACGLNNLQLIRAGEPLGGKASAESDFATDDDDDFLA